MNSQNEVDASPAKAFFVKMLTRDISLEDSIMDLIDNCMDGIIRAKWSEGVPESVDKPYNGFYAKIKIDEQKFSIEDNCGGIPKKIAEDSAFKLGRVNKKDDDIPTVGIYGIGMKRALFKMGQHCEVYSKTEEDSFNVIINKEWLEDDNEWKLRLDLVENRKEENGTLIEVSDLYEHISEHCSTKGFVNKFITLIQQHYSFIIQKGFVISVNEIEVEPVNMSLLINGAFDDDSLAPYIYRGTLDGVNVLLQVGFYRHVPDDDELEEEQVSRRSKEDAGWTVICNDRVVIYRDKTILTGWGEANVPQYHSQFVGISGLVIFRSNDVSKLPITTTKRGIDASSQIFLLVKNRMREGMKIFTDYTNKWKKDLEKEREHSNNAVSKDYNSLFDEVPEEKMRKLPTTLNPKIESEEFRFSPKLPMPSESNPRKFIRFARTESEIKIVSEYLFESSEMTAAEVGEKCFDKVLREAKE